MDTFRGCAVWRCSPACLSPRRVGCISKCFYIPGRDAAKTHKALNINSLSNLVVEGVSKL